jgi:hypothetical protein
MLRCVARSEPLCCTVSGDAAANRVGDAGIELDTDVCVKFEIYINGSERHLESERRVQLSYPLCCSSFGAVPAISAGEIDVGLCVGEDCATTPPVAHCTSIRPRSLCPLWELA